MHSAQGGSRAGSTLILIVWWALICGVIITSLLPLTSPVMQAIGWLRVGDRLTHFCAYALLALLPVAGFRSRRKGLAAGISMFLLGLVIEGAQHFSPGRASDLGDLIANGAGVSFGILLAPQRGSDRRPRASRVKS